MGIVNLDAELILEPVILLTVIVPVFNERATLAQLLHLVLQQSEVGEVIVVDDGSTDEGVGLLPKSITLDPRIRLIRLPKNIGKGFAIRAGLESAQGQYLVVQDADLEYSPNEYSRLLKPLQNGDAELVIGSRFLGKRGLGCRGRVLLNLGVRALNLAVWFVYGVRLTDEASCFKAIRVEHAKQLDLLEDGFSFCPELVGKSCRSGFRIVEVPIHYSPRNWHDGKKLRLCDGIHALRTLWKYRNWQTQQVRKPIGT